MSRRDQNGRSAGRQSTRTAGGGKSIRFEIPRRAVPNKVAHILGDRHTLQSCKEWRDIPPGHRFQLYFHALADQGSVPEPEGPDNREERDRLRAAAEKGDWDTLRMKCREPEKAWVPLKNQKRVALQAASGMGASASALLSALAERMNALNGTDPWRREATLIAPLATGLGNPHPVENGFAFLSPYGVPYIAGSGVKGVLRRAAEELALFEPDSRWTIAHVWLLFGFEENSSYLFGDEGSSCREAYGQWIRDRAQNNRALSAWKTVIDAQLSREDRVLSPVDLARALPGPDGANIRRRIHSQGALAFRDAFPDSDASVAVDILNPHHKSYYEGKDTPHDAESPIPVFFLTVAPGARFVFSAEPLAKRHSLWEAIGDWKALLDEAFAHACDRLGFGAKTSVGYGALRPLDAARTGVVPATKSQPEVETPPLSKEERVLERLRELIERDRKAGRKEPGGELNDLRIKLLKEARDWSPEMRLRAALLIEETLQVLKWPGNKEKQQMRTKELEELRNG